MQIRVLVLAVALCVVVVAAGRPAGFATAQPPARLFIPHTAGEFCGDFFDDFTGPPAGWFSGQYGDLMAEVTGGEYRMRINSRGAVWLVGAPACQRVDYTAAVDARWAGAPGNFYALLFGIDGELNRTYMFAVNTDARVWLVFEVRGSDLNTIIDTTGSDAIRPGGETNRLAARRAGDTIVLSINDVAVGELRDRRPGEPVAAGVAAATYTTQTTADARFDNFLYEGPATSHSPSRAARSIVKPANE